MGYKFFLNGERLYSEQAICAVKPLKSRCFDGMKNSNTSHVPKKFLSYDVNTWAYGFYPDCQEFVSLVKKRNPKQQYEKNNLKIRLLITF